MWSFRLSSKLLRDLETKRELMALKISSLLFIIQLSGFWKREMNNPLALCELAARAPNISAGHIVKQA
jgi:hypothetical protein